MTVQKPHTTRSDIYRDFKHSLSLLFSDLKATYRFISTPIKKISFSITVRYEGNYIPLSAYMVKKFEPVTTRFVKFTMLVNRSIVITVTTTKRLKNALKSFLKDKLKRKRKSKFKNLVQRFKSQFKKLSEKLGIKLEVKYGRD